MGIIGPTLPDLQLITDSSLQQASWLFAGFNIGYLISCGTSGFGKRQKSICLYLTSSASAKFAFYKKPDSQLPLHHKGVGGLFITQVTENKI